MARKRADIGSDGYPPTDTPPTEPALDDAPLTEAELTELALSEFPGQPAAADAVPLADYLGEDPGLLPGWYMPTPVVVAIVAAFVAIEAFGLCSTFGQIVPA